MGYQRYTKRETLQDWHVRILTKDSCFMNEQVVETLKIIKQFGPEEVRE